jgi:hypothetical protein
MELWVWQFLDTCMYREFQDLYISYIYPGVVGVWIGQEKHLTVMYYFTQTSGSGTV